tara:strand:- start:5427 stop:5663 length:237 start_codon:yes stop_codon:yes gene_type:complete
MRVYAAVRALWLFETGFVVSSQTSLATSSLFPAHVFSPDNTNTPGVVFLSNNTHFVCNTHVVFPSINTVRSIVVFIFQ